jgi:hypothetical protein
MSDASMLPLVNALKVLKEHDDDIREYYAVWLRQVVRPSGSFEDRLKDLFKASVNERRLPTYQKGKKAVEAFDSKVVELMELAEADDAASAHQAVFERLCLLPNVDQKIAAMFLKLAVNTMGVWKRFQPHLYVPLDRVVLKLLKGRLDVLPSLPDQSPSVKDGQKRLRKSDESPVAPYGRFLKWQCALASAAREAQVHRILVDELWLLGQLFCKPYPLCDLCWIRESCRAAKAGTDCRPAGRSKQQARGFSPLASDGVGSPND